MKMNILRHCSGLKGLKPSGYLFLLLTFAGIFDVKSQNPLIMDQFTADPTVRCFEGKLYLYPSHDIPCIEGKGFVGFCMPDYHVFSSSDFTSWKDHGVIFGHNDVAWVEKGSYRMWAPDCVYKNGKYYYFFPAWAIEKINGKGQRIGVAISETPYGPFKPQPEFLKGVAGIDPNVYIDDDGKAYMYWAENRVIYAAQLKDNMLELATEPIVVNIKGIDKNKFKEGPFVFKRDGKIYLTFPYIPKTTEQLVYAIGDSPLGDFTYKGVIMKEWKNKCYTNHQSIVEYKNQWYLFYHHNVLSPDSDKRRSAMADSLFFNPDGTIKEVISTLRGVGLTNCLDKIEIDRYSAISESGVKVDYLDRNNTFKGWKTRFENKGSWIRYNSVDFSDARISKVVANVKADYPVKFEVRTDSISREPIAEINLKRNTDGKWSIVTSKTHRPGKGIHDIFIISKSDVPFEVDYLKFIK